MNIITQSEKLSAQLISLQERIKTNQEIVGQKSEGSSEDDIASLYEMQAKAHSSIQHDRNLIRQTNVALRRINDGEYEYCETCGDDINPKRLVANPVSTQCIDCANIEFQKNKHIA